MQVRLFSYNLKMTYAQQLTISEISILKGMKDRRTSQNLVT